MSQQVHFIGGGQMSEAIIRALINHDVYTPKQLTVTDISDNRNSYLNETYDMEASQSLNPYLENSDLIIIGVRPQDDWRSLLNEVKEASKATILSIVAGVTIGQISDILGEDWPIVRIIPNTLTDTGLGYSGVSLNDAAELSDVEAFINGFGKIKVIDESLIDSFTGYGVCGPNWIYYFVESLADAGVLAGLPRDIAWDVALENLVGAVEMLRISGKHPRQLLDINNSPKGVGINGLHELNQSDFAAGLQKAVLKAVERTTELADE